jgi:transcriptional regulator with XRE-family HTH domain
MTTIHPVTLTSFVKRTRTMNDSDLLIKLGERIKTIRMKKNMTQNDLAIECDFEKASMSRIESGQSNPTIRTLYRISNALEIHITELFSDQV